MILASEHDENEFGLDIYLPAGAGTGYITGLLESQLSVAIAKNDPGVPHEITRGKDAMLRGSIRLPRSVYTAQQVFDTALAIRESLRDDGSALETLGLRPEVKVLIY